MGCRIGMATNVANRVRQLKADGTVPSWATYKTLASGLTYKKANEMEVRKRTACGQHCQGSAGGGYVPGGVWSVYRIDW